MLSALYTLSQFYRFSNAVIAPNLIQDLDLNAETLGLLGGAFFYSFALLQIPMGPMLDRFGPRIMITASVLIGAIGAIIFGASGSFIEALLGRILIGVGMSAVFMGAFKVFILRFSLERFTFLVGLIYAIGISGNIFAASPLALSTSIIGWRMSFIIAGIITALLGILIFLVLEGDKGKQDVKSEVKVGILNTLRIVLGSISFWQIAVFAFFRYGSVVGLQGLWLGPYLIDVYGYSPVQAGNLLIFFAIGAIIGGPISGRLSDQVFSSKKKVALWGMSFYALCLLPLTGILSLRSHFSYGFLFFAIGFFQSFGIVTFSHAKDLFPLSLSGTVMTWINFFTMSGGAIFMPALGKVIESFPKRGSSYPPEAYHLAFLICLLCVIGSLILYGFSKEKK